jgi:MoxR-like ATPase
MEPKMPKIFLKHPEVRKSETELAEALRIEQLAWNYKFKNEEMLSIFDEVREYLNYGAILNINEPELEEFKSDVEKRPDNGGINKKQPILFQDFKKLWELNQEIFVELLIDSIASKERAKFDEVKTEDAPEGHLRKDISEKELEEEINSRIIGKTAKLVYSLAFEYDNLSNELSEFSEDDLKDVEIYARANYGEIKSSLKEIAEIKGGIRAAKVAKNVEVIESQEKVATRHKVQPEKVAKTNSLLERVIAKKLKVNFKMGLEEKYDEVGNVVEKDFITAYVNYHGEMKNLYEMLNAGKIVETKYVKDIIETAMPALRKNPPTIVYLHGDFGTGKTALAVHISRTQFKKKPLIVSGSKFLDPDRFTEDFRLAKLASVEVLNKILESSGSKEKINDNITDAEIIEKMVGSKADIKVKIMENFKVELGGKFKEGKISKEEMAELLFEREKALDGEIKALFDNGVQGRYVLGAMYEAMNEGKPLIIDEANAISPDVLIAFNDLLTRKVGEKIKVRADIGEIEVKEGYCVMWTGNTGARYKSSRFNDIDPATYSRICPIEVKYLPQSTTVNNMDDLLSRVDLEKLADELFTDKSVIEYIRESKATAGNDQIFQVLLVKLLNRRLGTELLVKKDDRYSVFKDLYRLSTGARLIMDLFEKNLEGFPNSFPNLKNIIKDDTPTVMAEKLKKANLSMRELIDNIIGNFMDSGQAMDIEYYLFNFVKKYDMEPEEQAIIYALLKFVGFFEESEGWPDYSKCANLQEFKNSMKINPIDAVGKYKKIQRNGEYVTLLDTAGEYELQYFSSLETVQLLFGYLPPREKAEYEKIIEVKKKSAGDAEKNKELEKRRVELGKSIDRLGKSFTSRLCKTREDADSYFKLLEEVRALPIFAEELNLSDEDYINEVDNYCELLLNWLNTIKKISSEQLSEMEGKTPEEKSEFIENLLKNS